MNSIECWQKRPTTLVQLADLQFENLKVFSLEGCVRHLEMAMFHTKLQTQTSILHSSCW